MSATSGVAGPFTCALADARQAVATVPTPAAAATVLNKTLRFIVTSWNMRCVYKAFAPRCEGSSQGIRHHLLRCWLAAEQPGAELRRTARAACDDNYSSNGRDVR